MVFYLCGLKCHSSSDPAELPRNSRGFTSPSQPHAAALTLTFWTKHLSIIISQVSMTSLKANELWGVKVKLSSFFALCGYQSSICSAALWPNMENDAEFYKWKTRTPRTNSYAWDQRCQIIGEYFPTLGGLISTGQAEYLKEKGAWRSSTASKSFN